LQNNIKNINIKNQNQYIQSRRIVQALQFI